MCVLVLFCWLVCYFVFLLFLLFLVFIIFLFWCFVGMRRREKYQIIECDTEKFGTLDSSEKTMAITRRQMATTNGETIRA